MSVIKLDAVRGGSAGRGGVFRGRSSGSADNCALAGREIVAILQHAINSLRGFRTLAGNSDAQIIKQQASRLIDDFIVQVFELQCVRKVNGRSGWRFYEFVYRREVPRVPSTVRFFSAIVGSFF